MPPGYENHPTSGYNASRLPDVELEIRALAGDNRLKEACTLGVRAYGPEIMSYLYALLEGEQDASEVFSDILLKVWAGLPQFRWQCSFRTWTYAIARRALIDHRRAQTKGRRQRRLSEVQGQLAAEVRSATRSFLKSDRRRRLQQLREALDPEDQTLLILRVNRKLSWQEIAQVMADADLSPAEAQKSAAMLRKRFQRVKDELRGRLK